MQPGTCRDRGDRRRGARLAARRGVRREPAADGPCAAQRRTIRDLERQRRVAADRHRRGGAGDPDRGAALGADHPRGVRHAGCRVCLDCRGRTAAGRRLQPDLDRLCHPVCRSRRRFRHPIRAFVIAPSGTKSEWSAPLCPAPRARRAARWRLPRLATTLGFFCFLPTDYRGVAELGEIAGAGMLIAFATTMTLLPALLTVLGPGPEKRPMGFACLAPADRFLARHRYRGGRRHDRRGARRPAADCRTCGSISTRSICRNRTARR